MTGRRRILLSACIGTAVSDSAVLAADLDLRLRTSSGDSVAVSLGAAQNAPSGQGASPRADSKINIAAGAEMLCTERPLSCCR